MLVGLSSALTGLTPDEDFAAGILPSVPGTPARRPLCRQAMRANMENLNPFIGYIGTGFVIGAYVPRFGTSGVSNARPELASAPT